MFGLLPASGGAEGACPPRLMIAATTPQCGPNVIATFATVTNHFWSGNVRASGALTAPVTASTTYPYAT